MRIGQGVDIHGFAADRQLVLAGIEIPHHRGLDGHSDADVLLHAIMDALLGAAGLGDIGVMFPSSDPQWRGAHSLALLATVCDRVRRAGYGVGNIDTTIIAQEPRLSGYVAAMGRSISDALGLDETRVNVKATTSDRLGFTGRGEGIAAFAVVLLE